MEQYNPYTNRFERVKEGGPGSGRYPAGSGSSPRRSERGFLQRGIPKDAPRSSAKPTFKKSPGMQSSLEMYQKVDANGNKVFRESRNSKGELVKTIVLTDEREAYLDRLAEYHVQSQDATPVDNPVSTLMGGASGAGKGTFLKSDEGKDITRNAVKIDADEIKGMMAEYRNVQLDDKDWKGAAAFVHDESSMVADRALKLSIAGNFNTVYDGTGNGGEKKYIERLEVMHMNGGDINMVYIGISLPDALASVKARAEETRRFIPKAVVSEIHGGSAARFQTAVKLSTSRPDLKIKNIALKFRTGNTFSPVLSFTKGKVTSGNINDARYSEYKSYADPK